MACRKVDHGNHPDLHRLAPAGAGGQIRIDQARSLIVDLALLPLEGRFRVAIVAAAQRLNPDAQNALLKTLEEPPAGAVLVLCADDETLLLDTVRSRCARLRCGAVAAATIAELLVERGAADPSTAAGIARLADGRPGLAMALAASPDVLIHRARLSRSLLDLTGAGRRERLAASPALLTDAATVAEVIERRDGELAGDDADVSGGARAAVAAAGQRARWRRRRPGRRRRCLESCFGGRSNASLAGCASRRLARAHRDLARRGPGSAGRHGRWHGPGARPRPARGL